MRRKWAKQSESEFCGEINVCWGDLQEGSYRTFPRRAYDVEQAEVRE